jgi:hypothetical protein
VRRGASWTAWHLQLTVAALARPIPSSAVPLGVRAAEPSWVVARPTGGCAAEPHAGTQWSSVVAVVATARTPAVASVDGPRPACDVHPSGFIVRDPAADAWCPAVRCPVTWGCCPGLAVRPAAVHPSSVQPSAGPPVQPSAGPPVRCPARPVSSPSGVRPRPDASVSSPPQAVALGPGRGGGHRHHRTGSSPGGLPRRRVALSAASRPGGGRCCRVARWASGDGGGPGVRGRRRVTAERPGRPGRRAERRWLAAALWAREQAAVGGGRACRVAAVVGGGRPRWVVVAVPDAGAEGPGACRRGWAAAPARPRPAVGAPGWLPAVPCPAGMGGGPART